MSDEWFLHAWAQVDDHLKEARAAVANMAKQAQAAADVITAKRIDVLVNHTFEKKAAAADRWIFLA